MGQAKARGTFEERKAQAVIRRQEEVAQRAKRRALEAAERRRQASERQRLLSPQERKEAVMVAGSGPSRMDVAALLGIAMGAAAPLLVVDRERKPE